MLCFDKKEVRFLEVPHEEDIPAIIANAHKDGDTHLGENKTRDALQEKFKIKGVCDRIKQHIRQCSCSAEVCIAGSVLCENL